MRKTLVVLLVILKMNFVSTQQDYYDNYQVRFQNDNPTFFTWDNYYSQNVLRAVDCPLEPVLTAALSVEAEKCPEGQHR